MVRGQEVSVERAAETRSALPWNTAHHQMKEPFSGDKWWCSTA